MVSPAASIRGVGYQRDPPCTTDFRAERIRAGWPEVPTNHSSGFREKLLNGSCEARFWTPLFNGQCPSRSGPEVDELLAVFLRSPDISAIHQQLVIIGLGDDASGRGYAPSRRIRTISDRVPSRKGGPHVPTPLLVKTIILPKRFRP